MSNAVFPKAKKKFIDGTALDLINNTIKAALLSSAWTPNLASNEFFGDINANEIAVSGYTAGGNTLGTKAITISSPNVFFDAADTSWVAGATMTARYLAIYKSTGNNATSPLIGYIDFGVDRSVLNGETFYVEFPAAGIFEIS